MALIPLRSLPVSGADITNRVQPYFPCRSVLVPALGRIFSRVVVLSCRRNCPGPRPSHPAGPPSRSLELHGPALRPLLWVHTGQAHHTIKPRRQGVPCSVSMLSTCWLMAASTPRGPPWPSHHLFQAMTSHPRGVTALAGVTQLAHVVTCPALSLGPCPPFMSWKSGDKGCHDSFSGLFLP